jgi:hypothetical protein
VGRLERHPCIQELSVIASKHEQNTRCSFCLDDVDRFSRRMFRW